MLRLKEYSGQAVELERHLDNFRREGWVVREFPNTEESRSYVFDLAIESTLPQSTTTLAKAIEFRNELFLMYLPKCLLRN